MLVEVIAWGTQNAASSSSLPVRWVVLRNEPFSQFPVLSVYSYFSLLGCRLCRPALPGGSQGAFHRVPLAGHRAAQPSCGRPGERRGG